MSTQDLANYMENNGHGGYNSNRSEITYDVSSLDNDEQDIFHKAFDRWDEIIEPDFQSVTGNGEDITVKSADLEPGKSGSANKSTIKIDSPGLDEVANQGHTHGAYETLLHEIGHALGLWHPGPYNGDADFDEDAKFPDDSNVKTVMSYFFPDSVDKDYLNDDVDADKASAITPKIADFLAVKSMYGLESDTRDGNTTYGYGGNPLFDPNEWVEETTGNNQNASFMIYDTGGTDTIDMSKASSPQRIDLRPGNFSDYGGASDILGDRDNDGYETLEKNMSIAPGVTIEEAIGGKGDDKLIGNDADNRLNGGPGGDVVKGHEGHDTLFGGHKGSNVNFAEPDELKGHEGDDYFVFKSDNTAPKGIVSGGPGTDSLQPRGRTSYNLQSIDFSSIEKIDLSGTQRNTKIHLASDQISGSDSGLSDNLHVDTAWGGGAEFYINVDANNLDLSSWRFSGTNINSNLEFDIDAYNLGTTIRGSKLGDEISTGRGKDVVRAGAGSDRVNGDLAADTDHADKLLDGGPGEDDLLDYSDLYYL